MYAAVDTLLAATAIRCWLSWMPPGDTVDGAGGIHGRPSSCTQNYHTALHTTLTGCPLHKLARQSHLGFDLVVAAAEHCTPSWASIHLCVCLQHCQLLRPLLHLLFRPLKGVLLTLRRLALVHHTAALLLQVGVPGRHSSVAHKPLSEESCGSTAPIVPRGDAFPAGRKQAVCVERQVHCRLCGYGGKLTTDGDANSCTGDQGSFMVSYHVMVLVADLLGSV